LKLSHDVLVMFDDRKILRRRWAWFVSAFRLVVNQWRSMRGLEGSQDKPRERAHHEG
jgi:hypothetical protein